MNKMEVIKIEKLLDIAQNPDKVEWKQLREGVRIFPIYNAGNGGFSTALLRLSPGVTIPNHLHTGVELILVLAGSAHSIGSSTAAHDQEKGDCVIFTPGTSHSVVSKDGEIVLAIWEKPIQFT